MSKRRVTAFDNRRPDEAKIFNIPPEMSLSSFLHLVTQKLSLQSPASKLFLQDGGVVEDMEVVRDNDVLYVSQGEPFYKTQANAVQRRPEQCITYSIAVMGAGSVGKSALTLRYVQGVFIRDYDPTIEDAYRKSVNIDDRNCVLDILDTAGQEDYTALRSTWMRERDGFLLVYSIADRGTFDSLLSFYEQLSAMHEDAMPPIVLVGNKSDLGARRQVKLSEGKKLSESWNNCAFLETSAKSGDHIEAAFAALVREIRAKAQPAAEDKPRKKKWCTIL